MRPNSVAWILRALSLYLPLASTWLFWSLLVSTSAVAQKCGTPKSFDVIHLAQQFKSRRKRMLPGERPDLSSKVVRRDQNIIQPWDIDLTKSHDNVHDKIVGGWDVHDKTGGQICWQVGLIIGTADGYFNCGGSIIGSRTILTAAHCVYGNRGTVRPASAFTVVVGALDGGFDGSNAAEGATNCGKSFKVSKVTPHRNHSEWSSNNDLAILILAKDINLNSTCACAICLINKSPSVGEWVAVSGYGDVSDGGQDDPDPIPLRWVYLQILSNKALFCSFNPSPFNPDLFLCAGDVVGQDSCQGDSGGPLFAWDTTRKVYYLAGIVSFGDGCAQGIGGQYTKVQRYLSWIQANSQSGLQTS